MYIDIHMYIYRNGNVFFFFVRDASLLEEDDEEKE